MKQITLRMAVAVLAVLATHYRDESSSLRSLDTADRLIESIY